MTAFFPDIAPDYGLTKQSAPKLRKVQFGDGYEARIRFGLNQNPKTWNITWNNLTNAETLQVETFLDARADDGEAFYWRPSDGGPVTFLLTEDSDFLLAEDDSKFIDDDSLSPVYKWICETWDKTMNVYNRNTITATFRQVYDL